MSSWEYTETELWRFGEGEISIYHVFGSIAFSRSVLVFAEARESDGADAECPHSIVMRRSDNGGKTFYPSVTLVPAHGNCYVNPTPLYDSDTRRLFLFFAQNIGNTMTQNYVMYSDNAGATWSRPQNITPALDTEFAFHLPGPGHGTQLKNGRLLVPFWHRKQGVDVPKSERGYCVSFLVSDDHGKSWNHCGYFGKNCLANESRITETADRLIWNARGGDSNRYESYSYDGGDSWTEFTAAPIPPARSCDASIVSVNDDTVVFSHVSHPDKRKDIEILISPDGGRHYDDAFKLMQGDAMPGYTDMSVLYEDAPVICLVHARYDHVLFSRISMQTLTGGKFEKTSRNVWLNS